MFNYYEYVIIIDVSMCCCHKLLFALKQPLRPYLKEETQEYVWNVHPAVGVLLRCR